MDERQTNNRNVLEGERTKVLLPDAVMWTTGTLAWSFAAMNEGCLAVLVSWFRSLRIAVIFVSLSAALCAQGQHLPAIPTLRNGETLVYQLEITGSRSTKVESQVTTPQSPATEDLGARCLLQVNVVEAGAKGIRLKTYLSKRNAPSSAPEPKEGATPSPDKAVEVFFAPDGTASDIKGFAELTAAEQFAWQSWLNRFSSSMTFPKSGVHRGQRWKTSENETSPSPISDLSWERKYEYVKEGSCGPNVPAPGKSGTSRGAADLCAVIFVHARLRQKSSPKDATPEDYKRRGLRTAGTATGTNEMILYVSAATGLLVRSTEDAQQSMDVTVSLADGSNRIRYLITAKSRSQIQLLPDVPQDVR